MCRHESDVLSFRAATGMEATRPLPHEGAGAKGLSHSMFYVSTSHLKLRDAFLPLSEKALVCIASTLSCREVIGALRVAHQSEVVLY